MTPTGPPLRLSLWGELETEPTTIVFVSFSVNRYVSFVRYVQTFLLFNYVIAYVTSFKFYVSLIKDETNGLSKG
ncbi:hypothetical protein Taro_029157 [Colocasia esculenta]|uniref:Uncharacterized protein n=1 Tax=Colocasia esculenta TaxID=4460 RepID=A0A843VWD9_COLES|nr:hypothetical protein [Colocasia esculenta]